MTYEQALAYFESLGKFGIQLGLARIEALLERLGHPERRFRSVHVTGTNGKGSTTAMIAAVLNEAGIRTGMYTSPHLIDYPERLQLCGANISRPAFAEVIEQTKAMADAMIADGLESPTEFEVLTAAAFLWFARERAEIVVVEVGLGGLLDSTNVILPELAVITNVTLEHTDRCGDTVEEIAHHKAGIIKPGVPVVTGAAGAALAVIETAARQHGSVCEVLGREFTVTGSQIEQARQVFELRVGQTPPEFYSIGLLGRHQTENAALAVRACQLLAQGDERLTPAVIRDGLAKAVWPGRFEIFPGTPLLILDGAHNPDGIRTLRQTLDDVFPGRAIMFLFGVLADKNHAEMARTLFRSCDRAVVVRPHSDRAAAAADIAREIAGFVAAVKTGDTIGEGLALAKEWAGPDGIVCAAGSLYMIGEVRRIVVGEMSANTARG
ncbi:MAG: bifunctional folylpolyglutamate synthase/dihydrofolate synthase [Veillonellaceae bacterium]|jgi:dihydrofolate synthase/folylpolyglutamate synthase|nr:bifunctional folylpolyglutamate synthase/dihydrofolate synthase [Veillonellaceae bacterium]